MIQELNKDVYNRYEKDISRGLRPACVELV